jgi:hypothetical protein
MFQVASLMLSAPAPLVSTTLTSTSAGTLLIDITRSCEMRVEH